MLLSQTGHYLGYYIASAKGAKAEREQAQRESQEAKVKVSKVEAAMKKAQEEVAAEIGKLKAQIRDVLAKVER